MYLFNIIFNEISLGEYNMFRRIGVFLLVNVLVIATIGIVLNLLGVRGYMTANGINYTSLMIICLVWGMVGSFISLFISKFMAKMAYRMQKIEDNDPRLSWVSVKVGEFAKLEGIKKPEVYIYDSPEVNAFATGPTRNNSLVAVSSGLVNNMSQDEVEGVLAHEVGHISNGDMVTMALAQGVLNAFVMFLSRVAAFAISQALRSDDDEGPGLGGLAHFALVFVLDILFGILSMPILMWFSRFREFRADALGAKLAGRHKMIAALERLQNNTDRIDKSEPNLAAFKISNKSGMMRLFSSHPPLEERINALKRV